MAQNYSAVILAGGDGTRLQSLTRKLAGDDRPKQFCRLLSDRSLLADTRRRATRLIASDRLFTVVTRKHGRFYGSDLGDAASRTVVVQSENRGTAPAILYALLRLSIAAPGIPVAVLPSDHYVSDDDAFMARVEGALEAAQARPEKVILLGIKPDRPETEYGWIEPGELLLGPGPWPLNAVRCFWEKPPALVAERLARAGCLWNSFVIVPTPRRSSASSTAPCRTSSRHLPRSCHGWALRGRTRRCAWYTRAYRSSTSLSRFSRRGRLISPCSR